MMFCDELRVIVNLCFLMYTHHQLHFHLPRTKYLHHMMRRWVEADALTVLFTPPQLMYLLINNKNQMLHLCEMFARGVDVDRIWALLEGCFMTQCVSVSRQTHEHTYTHADCDADLQFAWICKRKDSRESDSHLKAFYLILCEIALP